MADADARAHRRRLAQQRHRRTHALELRKPLTPRVGRLQSVQIIREFDVAARRADLESASRADLAGGSRKNYKLISRRPPKPAQGEIRIVKSVEGSA